MTAIDLTIPAREGMDWIGRITTAWRSSTVGIIETGRLLVEAKAALAHGEFEKMVDADLPFSASTARRLMTIANDHRIANRAHAHVLPPSWMTLYELTKVPDDVFEAKVADGTINPGMPRKAVPHIRLVKPEPKKQRRAKLVTEIEETQHDRDVRMLLGVWGAACETARAEFLSIVTNQN